MKAIIWDMDGTITDTETYWIQNIFRLLEHYGVPDPRGKNAPWFGTATSETIRNYLASPDCRLNLTYAQCRDWCRNYIYTHTYASGAPLKPGALETLQTARNLGFEMCLVTNTELQALKYTLNRLNLARFFAFFVSVCYAVPDKHDPALFHQCAARMGVRASDCLLVEDSLYSIETGKRAGLTVWAIEDGKHIRHKARIQAAADRYFTDHFALKEALAQEASLDRTAVL